MRTMVLGMCQALAQVGLERLFRDRGDMGDKVYSRVFRDVHQGVADESGCGPRWDWNADSGDTGGLVDTDWYTVSQPMPASRAQSHNHTITTHLFPLTGPDASRACPL